MSKHTVRAIALPTPDHPDAAIPDPVGRLSFVAPRDGKILPKPTGGQLGRCFWHGKATGDYVKDCLTGEALALEYLASNMMGDPPALPGWQ
jgi:hypothetical protein